MLSTETFKVLMLLQDRSAIYPKLHDAPTLTQRQSEGPISWTVL